jgi:hypothetical protein
MNVNTVTINQSRKDAIAAMEAATTYRQKQVALKMAKMADMSIEVALNANYDTIASECDRLIAGYGPIVRSTETAIENEIANTIEPAI